MRKQHCRYYYKNIRTLLIDGFSEDELRSLCYDVPAFWSLREILPQSAGKTQMAERIIEFAERRVKILDLLVWAREHNPTQYQMHSPYINYHYKTPPKIIIFYTKLIVGLVFFLVTVHERSVSELEI